MNIPFRAEVPKYRCCFGNPKVATSWMYLYEQPHWLGRLLIKWLLDISIEENK